MSPLELTKTKIMEQLHNLCAHCASGREHNCPIQPIKLRIQQIRGVPLIVNDEFKGVLWR